MTRARRAAAVWAARVSSMTSRALGRGGTSLPGLVATAVDRDIVQDLALQLSCGSIVVSGTNGKTTSSRLLSGMLGRTGYHLVRNHSGSNLERGLAATLVREADLFGSIASEDQSIGVFEIDEAALPNIIKVISPRLLLLLNLFRDQLDRYGEVATVAGSWSSAVAAMSGDTQLLVNADDPLLATAVEPFRGPTRYFGIESAERAGTRLEHASDAKSCPRCGAPLSYDRVFLGHLGHYRCVACGLARPRPSVTASDVRLQGVNGSRFTLHLPGQVLDISFPLPGMYNVYNALAAAAAAHSCGVSPQEISTGLEASTAAFGRMERIEVGDGQAFLALAKNPAGLNEVLRTIAESSDHARLLMMLNDNVADGRDVSWIWDADVEMLVGSVSAIIFSGSRAEDMALRFRYAGALEGVDAPRWEVLADTRRAVEAAVETLHCGETLFIVPTYTAMLDVRGVLSDMGLVRPYWEE